MPSISIERLRQIIAVADAHEKTGSSQDNEAILAALRYAYPGAQRLSYVNIAGAIPNALMVVDPNLGNVIMVGGTQGTRQWLEHLWNSFVPLDDFEGVPVAPYYAGIAATLLQGIVERIDLSLPIHIFGHSLGGGVAQALAIAFKVCGLAQRIKVSTWASPMIGNWNTYAWWNSDGGAGIDSVRIVNYGDPVPLLPVYHPDLPYPQGLDEFKHVELPQVIFGRHFAYNFETMPRSLVGPSTVPIFTRTFAGILAVHTNAAYLQKFRECLATQVAEQAFTQATTVPLELPITPRTPLDRSLSPDLWDEYCRDNHAPNPPVVTRTTLPLMSGSMLSTVASPGTFGNNHMLPAIDNKKKASVYKIGVGQYGVSWMGKLVAYDGKKAKCKSWARRLNYFLRIFTNVEAVGGTTLPLMLTDYIAAAQQPPFNPPLNVVV